MSDRRLSPGRATASIHRHRRVPAVALALAVTAALAAGCGSSSSSSSSSAAAPTAATATSAETSTSAGTSTSASAGGGSGLSAATAFVKKYSSAPTSLTNMQPLKSKPPTGKTLVFLQCSLAQCQDIDNNLKVAVKALGWNLKTIDFDSSQSSALVAGLQTALNYHPVAVAMISDPYATWKQVIPAYQKAGVKIIPMTVGAVPISSTVPVNIGGPKFYSLLGQVMANWFIADSDGKGSAVFANAPEFQVFAELASGFNSTIKKNCPACKISTVNQSISDIENSNVAPIVSAVQRDSSIKYVLTSDGANILPLPSALKTAGLSDVKIAGATPTIDNEAALLSGTESAWAAVSFTIAAWQVVDSAARSVEGMKIPEEDGGLSTQILTKSNVGKPSTDYIAPSNYQAQFEKLWKVG
jgi:ribose transport system substrate-binding protein